MSLIARAAPVWRVSDFCLIFVPFGHYDEPETLPYAIRLACPISADVRHRLCKDATRRQFDVVMSWSVDRLGRSLQDLVSFLSELHAVGVDLYLHQQGIDTTTPAGKAMFQMMGVFAEFERSMIQERVKAGLRRARAQGKTLGRPKVGERVEKAVLAARAQGIGKRKIAKQLGIGVSTVNRILSQAP